MPRIHGYRQRIHQPFWDTLVRTTGPIVAPAARPVPPSSKLFANANAGDLALTNTEASGQLPSDQTYVILSLRSYLYFDGPDARTLYNQVSSQLFFTLNVGNKSQFQAGIWYVPAGGGVWTGGTGSTDPNDAIYANGHPTQSSILKLARPVIVPVRQNFNVKMEFFSVGTVDALTTLNGGAPETQKVIQFLIDGLLTRDVE